MLANLANKKWPKLGQSLIHKVDVFTTDTFPNWSPDFTACFGSVQASNRAKSEPNTGLQVISLRPKTSKSLLYYLPRQYSLNLMCWSGPVSHAGEYSSTNMWFDFEFLIKLVSKSLNTNRLCLRVCCKIKLHSNQ